MVFVLWRNVFMFLSCTKMFPIVISNQSIKDYNIYIVLKP